jgi:hypothetical protein
MDLQHSCGHKQDPSDKYDVPNVFLLIRCMVAALPHTQITLLTCQLHEESGDRRVAA